MFLPRIRVLQFNNSLVAWAPVIEQRVQMGCRLLPRQAAQSYKLVRFFVAWRAVVVATADVGSDEVC